MKPYKIWTRGLSLLLIVAMMTNTVFASVDNTQDNANHVIRINSTETDIADTEGLSDSQQENGTNTVRTLKVAADSKLSDISNANTIEFNADGEAVLSQSETLTASVEETPKVMSLSANGERVVSDTSSESIEDTQIPLMDGESVDVELSENENGTVDVIPNLDHANLVQKEEDADVIVDNPAAEYIGSNEGTDLATYQITPQDDAIYYDSVIDQSKMDMLSEYWNESYMEESEIQQMVETADAYEAEIAALRGTPEFEKLANTSTDSELVHKETVFGSDGTSEESILVVDDTIVCVYVKDEAGNPINTATVTSKLPNQDSQTVYTHEVGQDLKGIAVLKNLAGMHTGSLNISMDGYQVKTMLTQTFIGGSVIEVRLVKDNGDTYLRAAQIGYADAVNDTAKIELCQTTKAYKITALLSNRNGLDSLPSQLHLYAKEEEGERDLRTSDASSYSETCPTYQYVFENDWSNYYDNGDSGHLKIGDNLELVETGNNGRDTVYARLNAKVERAIVDAPVYSDLSFSIAGLAGTVKLPDCIPGVGGDNLDFDFLKTDFDLLICLDGTLSLSYKMKIKDIVDKDAFIESNYTPGIEKKANTIFESIENEFNKKMDLFMNGKGMLYDTNDRGFAWDPSAHLKVGAAFCMTGKYDSSTGYLRGGLKAMLTVEGDFGITFYAVIPPAVYAGFQVSVGGSIAGSIGVKFKPTDIMGSIGIDDKSGSGLLLGIQLGLMVYIGVGLRGVLCVEAQGSVGLNASLDFRMNSEKPADKSYPRVKVDGEYEVALEATILWITYHHTFLGDHKTFVDTWKQDNAEMDSLGTEETKVCQIVFDDTTMEATRGEKSSVNFGEAAEVTLDSAIDGEIIALNDKQDGADGYVIQQSTTDGISLDSKISYVDVQGVTYVFRIVQVKYWNTYPTLAYQKELYDGTFEKTIHLVPYNGEEYFDYEFDVYANRWADEPYVYIGLISGDRSFVDWSIEDYGKKTSSRVVIMNLAENKVLRNERLQGHDKSGDYRINDANAFYKYQPIIYGYKGNFAMTWQMRWYVDYMNKDVKNRVQFCAVNENGLDSSTSTKNIRRSSFALESNPVDNYVIGALNGWEVKEDNLLLIRTTHYIGDGLYIGSIEASRFDQMGKTMNRMEWSQSPKTDVAFSNGVFDFQNMVYKYTTPEGYLKQVAFEAKNNQMGFEIINPTILKGTDNNPFVLPRGSSIYQRCSSKNGELEKLAAIVNGDDGSQLYIYNIDVKNNIVHGPKIVKLDNQTICQMDTMYYEGNRGTHFRMVYTANKTSSYINNDDDSWDAKIKDACTLYRYEEPTVVSSRVTKLMLATSLVKKTNKTQEGKVIVENNGTVVLNEYSYSVMDQFGNELVNKTVNGSTLYPGEKITNSFTFTPRQDWEAGSEIKLIAKTNYEKGTGSDGEELTGIGSEEGEETVVTFNQSALELKGEDCIIGGQHVVALTMTNESAIASGSSTLTVYKNTVDGEKTSVYTTVDVGNIEDTYLATNNLNPGIKYNLNIPLQTCWEDQACTGVTIELNGENESENGISTIVLSNPLFLHKITVYTYPNDITYGETWGDGNYEEGAVVTLGANANAGYQFENWTDETGNVISSSAEFDYTVLGDNQSLYANFIEDGSIHKVIVDGETHLTNAGDAEDESGIYEVEEGKTFLRGAELGANLIQKSYMVPSEGDYTLIAEALQGYIFDCWIEVDEEGNELGTLSWDAEYIFIPDHEMHVRALFSDINTLHNVMFYPLSGSCNIPGSLTWEDGTLRTIPEASKEGFDFLGWFEEDGTQIGKETVFEEDMTVYARYAPQKEATFTIYAESTEGGSVDPSGEQKVAAGADFTVTTKSDQGYRFDGWEVDGLLNVFAEETYTFTQVDQNHTIRALFVKDESPIPTVTPTGNPTPTGSPTPTAKPTITGKPETNSGGAGSETNKVKTGDDNQIVLWGLMCSLAAAVFTVLGFTYVKKKRKNIEEKEETKD